MFLALAPAPAIIRQEHLHNQHFFSNNDNKLRFLLSYCPCKAIIHFFLSRKEIVTEFSINYLLKLTPSWSRSCKIFEGSEQNTSTYCGANIKNVKKNWKSSQYVKRVENEAIGIDIKMRLFDLIFHTITNLEGAAGLGWWKNTFIIIPLQAEPEGLYNNYYQWRAHGSEGGVAPSWTCSGGGSWWLIFKQNLP